MPTVLTVEFSTAALTPTVYEGNLVAVSTVTLSRVSSSNVSVDYDTSDSTAAAGTDYTTAAGTLTFTPGQTTQQISIPILGGVGDADNTFCVTLSDPSGASLGSPATQTIAFTVANPVSVTNPGSQSNYDGDTVSLSVGASDALGNSLSYSASGLPSGLGINSSTGVISGTIASSADTSSPYSVTVTATDSAADVSASQTFSWYLAAQQVYVVGPGDRAILGGSAVSTGVFAGDSAGHSLTFTASNLPAGVSIDPNTGAITGAVATSAISATPYDVTITATDAAADVSGTATFNWTIVQIALGIPGSQRNVIGDTVSVALSADDALGNTVTFSAANLPDGLTIDASSGVISGTIVGDAPASSPYSVAVAASDGSASVTRTFTWTVGKIALQNPGIQFSTAGAAVSLALAATVPTGDPVAFTATGLPPGLTVDADSGIVGGTIAAGTDGDFTVTVNASDSTTGAGASRTFTWMVSDQGTGTIQYYSLAALALGQTPIADPANVLARIFHRFDGSWNGAMAQGLVEKGVTTLPLHLARSHRDDTV